MTISRRTMLHGLLLAAGLPGGARAADAIRIGVLRFGTVAWELDVIRTHGLDAAAGIAVEPVEYASSTATEVALQAHEVDMVALDWLWVTRQRGTGADWTFSALSNAVGAIEAPAGSSIKGVADLAGKRLGIAGTAIDKSWLILRAYALRRLKLDLDQAADKSFGAPPLLDQELKAGRLDAVLNFWPYAAKEEAAGARRIAGVAQLLAELGIPSSVPMVGYAFSEAWAAGRRDAVTGFLEAGRQARDILAQSDAEWQRLAPRTGAADAAELARLRDWYRSGIPGAFDAAARQAADRLFTLLAATGGAKLVGAATAIAPGTFWATGEP